MNSYFSRLAERSGVASTAEKVRPTNLLANAAPDWSEQSIEKTTPANALVLDTESGTFASAIESKSIQTSGVNLPAPLTQSTDMPSKPLSAQQHKQKAGSLNTSAKSSLVSNTLTTGSTFIEHDSFRDSLNPEVSVSSLIPDERQSKSESLATSAKHSSTIFDNPSSSKPSLTKFIEDRAHPNALSRAAAEMTEPQLVNTHSIQSTQADVEREIKNTAQRVAYTPLATRASAVQSRHADVSTEQVKSIVAAPVQALAVSLQTPRATPRSSIEVHIGKIELEIFSPTRKPVAPTTPVQVLAPRATTAAAFNPHRHYLRSR